MATDTYDTTDERNVPKGKGGNNDDLHATGLRHANEAWRAEQINIAEGREDQRFAFGEQWPANDKLERDKERRPSITVNRLPQFKRQVTGDIRKDTPSSKVIPAKDGTKEMAEIYTGMIRNIEQQSNAKAAYIQAVENAVDVGMGCWRIINEPENDNSFEQVLRIERILDPFGFLFDANAKKPDKTDARFVFVFDDIAEEEFKRQWPNATTDNFPSPPEGGMIWRMDKTIRIAEYWYKEEVTKTLEMLEDGTTRYADDGDDDETADQKEDRSETVAESPAEGVGESEGEAPPDVPQANGAGAGMAGAELKVIQSREVKTWKIKWVRMSGREILEEPEDWPGRYLPFVPVIGEEARIDGRTLRKGMIRDAKGPQQVYNYMRTAAAEFVGKQPSAPFVGTVKQFAGYEHIWQEAGSANHSYLPYNVDQAAPGAPQRSMPPSGATGLDQQALIAVSDMEAVIGIYRSNLGAPSNETSGRAIMARQREGDTGSFFYVDNLRSALAYSAKILLDLIPKVYDTPRVIRTLNQDGEHAMVPINGAAPPGQPSPMPPGKQMEDLAMEVRHALNDLSIGEYDVVVSSGQGLASQRQEAVASMTEFIQAYPPAAPVIGDLLAKNQDWPGAEEIAARLKTLNPLFQPPKGPDPEVMATVELKGAQAAKARAEAEGQEVTNVETAVGMIDTLRRMEGELAQLKQTMDAMSGPPGSMQPPPEQMNGHTNGQAGPPQIGELEPMPRDHMGEAIHAMGQHAQAHSAAIQALGQHLHGGMQAMGEGLNKLADAHMAETEVVRGEDGRPTGVRRKKAE